MVRRLSIPVALVLVLSSCRASEPWTFALTRQAYGPDASYVENFIPEDHDDWRLAAGLILAPLAVDLVFLPVAVTRDLCVRGHLE